jgi:predicted DNA-binding protein (MmcQ/YjbR family)
MDVNAVKEFCNHLAGSSSKLYESPSNVLVYYVAGKKFAYFKTSEPEQWRFSLCSSPDRFLELTDMPGIKPARYMARFRWITIVDVNSMPADYLQELIMWSYTKASTGRSKRKTAVAI